MEEKYTGLEIAVIGISCNFPGAPDIKSFWDNIKGGKESIKDFSDEELLLEGYDENEIHAINSIKSKGFIDDIEFFDANFFGYTPKEASIMDPQLRLFHESVWHAIEDAGINLEHSDRNIGIYAGAGFNPHWINYVFANKTNYSEKFITSSLNSRDFLTTRISHFLNLKGPSINVQTACSTSLVAVHTACQGLLGGDCNIAIAGGVSSLILTDKLQRKSNIGHEENMILSTNGRCKAFDKNANGIVGGEGSGVVVLKRLDDALRDQDNIYAIIKGSSVNNDGNDKAGYSAPGVDGQSKVIKNAHLMSNVDPESISYIETHGTGTKLGDACEIEALKKAFNTQKKNFCALGSVKSNIGHLDSGSGIAGLIKTVLIIKNKQIPPQININEVNPNLKLDASPFYINRKIREWNDDKYPLRAGISSFGIGGTNAHIILEQSPIKVSKNGNHSTDKENIIQITANSEKSLKDYIQKLINHLENKDRNINNSQLSYSLNALKKQFPYQLNFCSSSIDETIDYLKGNSYSISKTNRENKIVFMFTGQGSQYISMGRDLYINEPYYAQIIDSCLSKLKTYTSLDLDALLFYESSNSSISPENVHDTEYTQPLLFIIEYALAMLLMKWGIVPEVMIGHSIGEYVAACISGVFSIDDALRIVTLRGKLMSKTSDGRMLASFMSQDQAKSYLSESISLASINTGNQVVFSGETKPILDLKENLDNEGYNSVLLKTKKAFHSHLMEPILADFKKELENIEFKSNNIPYISNVTGNFITIENIRDINYWAEHLRKSVSFYSGINQLLSDEYNTFIEVGPGDVLTQLTRSCIVNDDNNVRVTNLIKSKNFNESGYRHFLTNLNSLLNSNVKINWVEYYSDKNINRIELPGYSFDKKYFWPEKIKDKVSKLDDRDTTQSKGYKIYHPSWSFKPLDDVNNNIDKTSIWLVFLDDLGYEEQIINDVLKKFESPIIIKKGNSFNKTGNSYIINKDDVTQAKLIADELYERGIVPNHILYMWNFNSFNGTSNDKINLAEADFEFFFSFFRAYNKNFSNNNLLKIFFITNQLYDVIGSENLNPYQSLVLGFNSVIPLEYKDIKCKNIDLAISKDQKNSNTALILYDELVSKNNDAIVSIRHKKRWIRVFNEKTFKDSPQKLSLLQDKGVYIIIGGVGSRSGIGYHIACYLASLIQCKIVFLSRSQISYNSSSIASNEQSKNKHIKLYDEIERLGAEVYTAKADLSDYESISSAITKVKNKYGKINGVFNVAGLMSDTSLSTIESDLPIEIYKKQFEAKVIGTQNLYSTLRNEDIDFILNTSSLSSFFGPFVSYSAANNFIDTFSHYISKHDSKRTICINWDNIQNIDINDIDTNRSLSADEFIDSLDKALYSSHTHLAVTTKEISMYAPNNQVNIKNTFDLEAKSDISNWFYLPEWRIFNRLTEQNADLNYNSTCLIFKNDSNLSIELENQIKSFYTNVLFVQIADNYDHEENLYSINPAEEEHFFRLIADIKNGGYQLGRIICTWNYNNEYSVSDIERYKDISYHNYISLAQTLNKFYNNEKIKFTLIVDGLFNVTGKERMNPLKSLLLGPIKIIPLEYPNIDINCIDVEFQAQHRSKYINLTSNIIANNNLAKNISAYRENNQWILRYKPIKLNKNVRLKNQLIYNGVYLLFGGLGGMALQIAKHLIDNYNSKIVLIDNKPVSLVLDDCADDSKIVLQKLLKKKENGYPIEILNVDIRDYDGLEKAIDQVYNRFSLINGVFHCAGSIDDYGIIQNRKRNVFSDNIDAKLLGALNISRILRNAELDFLVFFSSIGNVLHNIKIGQVGYNSANEFLDSFANYLYNEYNINSISINWNDWTDVGMNLKANQNSAFPSSSVVNNIQKLINIEPSEGIILLERILKNRFPQIVISKYCLNEAISYVTENIAGISAIDTSIKKNNLITRSELEINSEYREANSKEEKEILEIFINHFEIQDIGVFDNFFELGGDSLKAINIIAKINEKTGVNIPITTFYSSPNIHSISEYIIKQDKSVNENKFKTNKREGNKTLFEAFPLSPIQMAYYMGRNDDFELGGFSTHVYQEFEIYFDITKFNIAFNKVVERHPMLRMIVQDDGNQRFIKESKYKIEVADISGYSAKEQKAIIKKERSVVSNHKFEPNKLPLFLLKAYKINVNHYYLLFSLDHLVADAASIIIIFNDLVYYCLYENGSLQELRYTYKDYIEDTIELKQSNEYRISSSYWLNKLESFPDAPQINLVNSPEKIKKPSFSRLRRQFSALDYRKIKETSRKLKITPSVLICTAYAEVLSYWSNQPELTINLTLFNRYPFHEDINKIVGDFTSILLLGLRLDMESFEEKVLHVNKTLSEAIDNRYFDGTEFIRELRRKRGLGTKAIMPYVFTSAIFEKESFDISDDSVIDFLSSKRDSEMSIGQTAQVYIDCTVSENNDNLEIVWDYVDQIFNKEEINYAFDNFISIISSVINNNSYSLVPSDITKNIIVKSNTSNSKVPENITIIEAFEVQVNLSRDRVALVYNDTNISYGFLLEQVCQLSQFLTNNLGLSTCVIGVLMDKSIESIVSILSILRIGGTYLPIDPSYPKKRINYMISDSNVAYCLTTKSHIEKFPDINCNFIDIANLDVSIRKKVSQTNIITNSFDPAYIIYTSGTTGKPKGVIVENRNVTNLLLVDDFRYDFNKSDICPLFHSISFDVSVWEMYLTLLNGGKLLILPKIICQNTKDLRVSLLKNCVTFLNQTPSAFQQLTKEEMRFSDEFFRLKYIVFAGEALNPILIKEWNMKYPETKLINMYGITETTVHSTYKEISNEIILQNQSNIGIPLPLNECYILDYFKRALQLNVQGEIYVSGNGVSRGYLNNPTLTNERFQSINILGDKKRCYKSGDIAKLLENGDIEYVGRSDNQIKVRGFRIEIKEIENVLLGMDHISNAVIIPFEKNNLTELCAYLETKTKIANNELREYLKQSLPEYMIPNRFMCLEEFPVNANGKINKKKLPLPDEIQISSNKENHTLPLSHTQLLLRDIFQDVLGIKVLNIDIGFFDMGGDSFKAFNLISRLKIKLNVEVPLTYIFKNPTICDIEKFIKNSGYTEQQDNSVRLAEHREFYPLSAAQKRLYIQHQLYANSIIYNLSFTISVLGNLDIQRLEYCFNRIVNRHESFRTSFLEINGEYVQVIHKKAKIKLIYFEGITIHQAKSEFFKPFDLNEYPLLRVGILKQNELDYCLLIDMDHIISDGVSLNLILDELVQLYEEKLLSELRYHYKDYVYWHNELMNSSFIRNQKEYWLNKFVDDIPLLNLPTDFQRNKELGGKGKYLQFVIEGELLNDVRKFIQEKEEITMNAFLFSVFNILLSKFSGQDDIVIGCPIAVRQKPEFEQIVGLFANVLPFRNFPHSTKSYTDFLKEIRTSFIEGLNNKDYQIEDLIGTLNKNWKKNRNPLFDVVFAYGTRDSISVNMNGVTLKPLILEKGTTPYDLVVNAFESDSSVLLVLEYSTALFKEHTAQNYIDNFFEIIHQVIERKDILIGDIELKFNYDDLNLPENIDSDDLDFRL